MPITVRTVFVSSTFRDLAKYRARVLQAISGSDGLKGDAMERFGARPATPAAFCIERVQECDLFVGILGVCYGSSPPRAARSYTEIEYDTARRRKKPCLMFLSTENFKLPKNLDEQSCHRAKQDVFRRRVRQDYICSEFRSPDHLASLVSVAIRNWENELGGLTTGVSKASIPLPPEPCFATRYPLQRSFIGRSEERALLTEWWRRGDPPLLALLGLGGVGKSALAWVWLLSDVYGRKLPDSGPEPPEHTPSPVESPRPEGVFWWSFHEQESNFVAFLDTALIYASAGTVDPATYGSPRRKTAVLLNLLQQRRLLLVLDGLERELYSPSSTRGRLQEIHGDFLKGLASLPMRSRTVLTSRYLPPELKGLGGCRSLELRGLDPADAEEFLYRQGVQGSRAEIQALGKRYAYHPLSLSLLADYIANDKREPGEIRTALRQPELRDLGEDEPYPVVGLAYGMLSRPERGLLHGIAACRGPISYQALETVAPIRRRKPIDAALDRLIDLGLLSFDREQRRFDLHPLVREYTYRRIQGKARRAIHQQLASYFATFPPPTAVRTIEDLNTSIELYHHNVKSGNYEQAYKILHDQLFEVLHHRLGAYSINIELLHALFPDGVSAPPRVQREPIETLARPFHTGTAFSARRGLESPEAWTLSALGISYRVIGSLQEAEPLLEQARQINEQTGVRQGFVVSLINLADVQWTLGKFRAVEESLRLQITRSLEWGLPSHAAVGHQDLGLRLAFRGEWTAADEELRRACELAGKDPHRRAIIWAHRARKELLLARATSGPVGERAARRALTAAKRAGNLLRGEDKERHLVRALWLQGAAHRTKGDLRLAGPLLRDALDLCQDIDLVEFEADILLDLAQLRVAEGKEREAESLASEALTIAERGGYVLQKADAHLVLAQRKLQQGNRTEATTHAQMARAAASCDGPGYSYQVAFDEANALLCSFLGADSLE